MPDQPGQGDPMTMPLSQLQAQILSEMDKAAEPEPEPQAEPEPPPIAAEEAEPAAEPEPEKEPKADEPTSDDLPTDDEILQARLDLLDAQQREAEARIGRFTGEAGYLRQKNQELLTKLEALGRVEDGEAAEPQATRGENGDRQVRPDDRMAAWAVRQALTNAGQEFRLRYPQAFVKDAAGAETILPELVQEFGKVEPDLQRVLISGDPLWVQQQAMQMMEGAFIRAEKSRKEAHFKELLRRKGESSVEMRKRKQASASASTGGGTTPKPKPLDPRKLPLDELKRRILEGRFT